MQGIILGDAYKLIKEIPDKSIDCIITDPPYDIKVEHGAGAFGVKKKVNYKELADIASGFDYSILDDFVRVLKKINIYIFCSRSQFLPLLNYFVKQKECNWSLINWHKDNVLPACGNRYLSDTEYCLFFREKGVKVYGNFETKRTYYITHRNTLDKKTFNHPTPKPLFIIKNFVINSTQKGEQILDPFSGSGTVAAACEELGRSYVAFENNKSFYDASLQRLAYIKAQNRLFKEKGLYG